MLFQRRSYFHFNPHIFLFEPKATREGDCGLQNWTLQGAENYLGERCNISSGTLSDHLPKDAKDSTAWYYFRAFSRTFRTKNYSEQGEKYCKTYYSDMRSFRHVGLHYSTFKILWSLSFPLLSFAKKKEMMFRFISSNPIYLEMFQFFLLNCDHFWWNALEEVGLRYQIFRIFSSVYNRVYLIINA